MKSLIYTSHYFFINEEHIEKRKTPILHISTFENIKLGQIKWYAPWRKFCFYPEAETIWDNKCLAELNKFLEEYNFNWKSTR